MTLLVLADPFHEVSLFLTLFLDDSQVLESEPLALPFLPAIGAAGVFVGILQADRRIGLHPFPHDVLAEGPGVDRDSLAVKHGLELCLSLEPLGAARVAHDHRVIALLDALEGNLEGLGGNIRLIGRGIRGRLIVSSGIDPEHGEVAGVAGPHPVVGLATELSDRCRRGADKADIGVSLVNYKIPNVLVVERGHLHPAVGVVVLSGLLESLPCGELVLGFGHRVCHVGHADEIGHRESGSRNLLLAAHCPETVFKVVMLVGGKGLDGTVAAVVVGHKETLVRDHLSCATASEDDDGVLKGGVVDAVDLLGGKPATEIFHGSGVEFLNEGQKPHTLISHGARGDHQSGGDGTKDSFHHVRIMYLQK